MRVLDGKKGLHEGALSWWPLVYSLTREVLGFEETYMHEILVTEKLRTSACARECRFFWKTLQTYSRCHCRSHCRSHTQYRCINYKCKWGISIKMLKAIWMTTKRTMMKSRIITCNNCTFYHIIAERHINDTCEVVHRFTNIVASILPGVTKHWSICLCR